MPLNIRGFLTLSEISERWGCSPKEVYEMSNLSKNRQCKEGLILHEMKPELTSDGWEIKYKSYMEDLIDFERTNKINSHKATQKKIQSIAAQQDRNPKKQKAANARWANDKKTEIKCSIYKEWARLSEKKKQDKYKADFAEKMCEKYNESGKCPEPETMVRWFRNWEKGKKPENC